MQFLAYTYFYVLLLSKICFLLFVKHISFTNQFWFTNVDCGSVQECSKDPCCEPLVCRLKTSAQCSSGHPCCESCKVNWLQNFLLSLLLQFPPDTYKLIKWLFVIFQFKGLDTVCRPKQSECDIPEYCTGQSGECPLNTYKKNGAPCGKNEGYCFNGYCPTLDGQCRIIWDVSGK